MSRPGLASVDHTDHGFEVVRWHDLLEQICTLRQSSTGGGVVRPGTAALRLGVSGHRMHLHRRDVICLVGHLMQWLATGSLRYGEPAEKREACESCPNDT